MNKLYIDDIRDPTTDEWIVVRSYDEAISWMIKNGCPQTCSFDHDLGSQDEKTGYDIAKWMVENDMDSNGKWMPFTFTFTVHSANPVGAKNIQCLLDNYLSTFS